jgi:hypothetical protein
MPRDLDLHQGKGAGGWVGCEKKIRPRVGGLGCERGDGVCCQRD